MNLYRGYNLGDVKDLQESRDNMKFGDICLLNENNVLITNGDFTIDNIYLINERKPTTNATLIIDTESEKVKSIEGAWVFEEYQTSVNINTFSNDINMNIFTLGDRTSRESNINNLYLHDPFLVQHVPPSDFRAPHNVLCNLVIDGIIDIPPISKLFNQTFFENEILKYFKGGCNLSEGNSTIILNNLGVSYTNSMLHIYDYNEDGIISSLSTSNININILPGFVTFDEINTGKVTTSNPYDDYLHMLPIFCQESNHSVYTTSSFSNNVYGLFENLNSIAISDHYANVINSNITYVNTNIELYIRSTSNLSDVETVLALSNLSLDKLVGIPYSNNDLSNANNILKVENDLYLNFLTTRKTGLTNQVIYSSNNEWGLLDFQSNYDGLDYFDRASSNLFGMVNMDESNDTRPVLMREYSNGLSNIMYKIQNFDVGEHFDSFLSTFQTSPESNMLEYASNLNEIKEYYLLYNDAFSNHNYNLDLHIISFVDHDNYSNLRNAPNTLNYFHNDIGFVKRNNCLSEMRSTASLCKSNLQLGTICSQNNNNVDIRGKELNFVQCCITDIFQINDGTGSSSNKYLNLSDSGSNEWSSIYEFDANNSNTKGIVKLFNEMTYDDNSTYTPSLLKNKLDYFRSEIENMNKQLTDLEIRIVPI
jgi:hypothetical protein